LQSKNQAIVSIKQNLSLCYLQLSQTIPVTIHCLLLFIVRLTFKNTTIIQLDAKGRQIFTYSETFAYAYVICWNGTLIFESLTNDMHFYLFLIFGSKFREEFSKRILRRGN
jgi:hypothetical protein